MKIKLSDLLNFVEDISSLKISLVKFLKVGINISNISLWGKLTIGRYISIV